MIKIPISEKQKEKIEKIYWGWMKKYHLEELIETIEEDDVIKELILEGEEDLRKAIKKYLLSDYSELFKIKSRIDKFRTENKRIDDRTESFLKKRYENYRDSQAAKVVNVLEISVCPYCNQNHINVVCQKGGRIRLWGDLDHFYDKSTYPELMVCLYNLIPVCKVCNQLKSSQKGTIINPYNCQINSNIKFKTVFDDKLDIGYLQGKSQNFNIVIEKESLTEEDKEEIRLFDLENRYKQLKQNAQEIIIKSKAYDLIYQEQLMEKFELSEEELSSYIFGYTDNHLNRILSKFNLDMANEFRGSK